MDEVRIADGPLEVHVLPDVGARIHRLIAFGQDLLRTPDDPEAHRADPFFWGAYVMAPWCGRIDAGETTVGKRTLRLAPNFPDGTAIHGQVYDRPWESFGDAEWRVRAGGDGWPWAYEVRQQVEVRAPAVRIQLGLLNLSDESMPAGIGLHPWFRRPIEVAIRGDRVYTSNTAPSAMPTPVIGAFDLRTVGPMSGDLDATWTNLGEPPVTLRWPDKGVQAEVRATAPSLCIVAASPSRLDAIAVEPQTHAPAGIRRFLGGEPDGLSMLAPGRRLDLSIHLRIEPMSRPG